MFSLTPKNQVLKILHGSTTKNQFRSQSGGTWPDTGDYLYKTHVENKDWYLAYNGGSNYYKSSIQQIQAASPQQKQQFMNNIYDRARTQFQYVFYQYFISQAIKLKEPSGHPMHQIHEFMNSEEVLKLMTN